MAVFHPIDARLDWLLRMTPALEARFETETRSRRLADVRHAIIVGLVLYNVYNFTSVFLLPGVLWLSVSLRVLLVTPTSLGLAWLIGRLGGDMRERAVAFGVFNAFVIPVFLFWLSAAPEAAYTFGELALTLVFANMVALLRFRLALLFTAACFLVVVAAVLAKSDMPAMLVPAFLVQFATACFFTLYANWRAEHARCRSFLAEVDAGHRADDALRSSMTFRDLSLTDALTGLPNRRALDADMARLSAGEGPLSLLMVDVDHFKLFNDRLGHPAGDDCLRVIARCIAETAGKAGGMAARFGGEEFAVLLPEAGSFAATRLASGLVEAVRALELPHPARPDRQGRVTVSVGLAHAPSAGEADPEAILAGADAALYAAKRSGRDGWSAAGDASWTAAG